VQDVSLRLSHNDNPPGVVVVWGVDRGIDLANYTVICTTLGQLIQGVTPVALGLVNPLTLNDSYSGRTAPLTSKVAFYIFIQQI